MLEGHAADRLPVLEVPARVDCVGGPVVTGYKSRHFRHDCGRRGCYIDQLPSWDELIDVLPRGIRPTDVDGVIEINHHFLFLEEKGAGVGLNNTGQRVLLQRLAELPRVRVVVFRPAACGLQTITFPDPHGWVDRSVPEFLGYVSEWCRWTDAQPVLSG